jgi:transposase
MRGADRQTAAMFSYRSPEAFVPPNHPLRTIRPLVNAALDRRSPDFAKIYAPFGRQSIAPEKLLRALLRQAFFSVRSERQLMEQLTSNIMFRWFVGFSMDASVWDVTVFSKNRDRLPQGDIARRFLAAILVDPQVKPLLSDEHFSVDGSMIEAWASLKSFQPKDGSGEPPAPGRNNEVDFRGQPRSNETHASTTDPDARLYKKAAGQAAKLCHLGHGLMENASGLVVAATLTKATGTAEREAAIEMVGALAGRHRITVGGDKAYDTADLVADMRELGVTPHVAQNTSGRRSAIDRCTTRHHGDRVSQKKRQRIEAVFGWIKSSAGFRKTRPRGTERVGWLFTLHAAAYNLVRLATLLGASASASHVRTLYRNREFAAKHSEFPLRVGKIPLKHRFDPAAKPKCGRLQANFRILLSGGLPLDGTADRWHLPGRRFTGRGDGTHRFQQLPPCARWRRRCAAFVEATTVFQLAVRVVAEVVGRADGAIGPRD